MSALSAVLLSRVWCRRKFVEVSCTECTGQSDDFQLIPIIEMETRNFVKSYFGSEFPAICNYCWVMAAWSRKTLTILRHFLFFLEKRPLTVKFINSVPKVFIVTPIDVSCSNFVNVGQREIGEIVFVGRPTWQKNFAWLSNCRYCADSTRNLPGPARALDFIQIGSLSVEL